jgi:protein-disulfide isomerase
MTRSTHDVLRIAALVLLLGSLGLAQGVAQGVTQDWQTAATLPGIDLNGLSAAQKSSVLRVMRAQGCSCGCDMRMAECRVKDPGCGYSKGMAAVVIESIKAGKTEQQAFDAAKASKWGHLPEPKLLDDPVTIPVSGSPVLGPESAKIVIVEFSDFQCPYCILAVPQIQAVLKAYPTQAKLIFKQFPLEIHSRAFLAASSALAARNQGKFWEMHDAMFAHHDELSRETFVKLAQGLGLDVARFEKDMDSDEVKKSVQKDVDDGERAGVQGTPTIFINGQRYNGPITLAYLKQIFDGMLKDGKSQTAALR